MDGKPKTFELMKHTHEDNPNSLEKLSCEHCTFDNREKSLQEHIKSHTGLEKIKSEKPGSLTLQSYTFKNMKVMRGKFDDVIGWSTTWQ